VGTASRADSWPHRTITERLCVKPQLALPSRELSHKPPKASLNAFCAWSNSAKVVIFARQAPLTLDGPPAPPTAVSAKASRRTIETVFDLTYSLGEHGAQVMAGPSRTC
jgi:hypothetical protein